MTLALLSVFRGRDPSAVAVLLEDSAAVTGVLLASTCLGLVHYTGNPIYDAVGSISIGGADTHTHTHTHTQDETHNTRKLVLQY